MKMKFYLIILLVLALFYVTGCKEKNTDPSEEVVPCTLTVTNVKVEQRAADILLTWESNQNVEKYIIAYHTTGDNPDVFENKIEVGGNTSHFMPIEDLNLTDNGFGWYNLVQFFVGGVCSDGSVVWNEKSALFIPDNFIHKPVKLQMDFDDYLFSWEDTLDNPITKYVVEYGKQGFNLGSGISANKAAFGEGRQSLGGFKMYKDSIYDFYVRAVISGGESSSWAGPLTVKSKDYVNVCPLPTNIKFDFPYPNKQYADITFDHHGFNIFYWKSVARGDDPDLFNERFEILTGDVGEFSDVILPYGSTLPTDFYIRLSCGNGTGEQWAGPIPINY